MPEKKTRAVYRTWIADSRRWDAYRRVARDLGCGHDHAVFPVLAFLFLAGWMAVVLRSIYEEARDVARALAKTEAFEARK